MKVAVSGKIASGKSTVAKAFCKLLNAQQVAIAEPLKQMAEYAKEGNLGAGVAIIARITPNPIHATLLTRGYMALAKREESSLREDKKPRTFLQQMGTDVGRRIDPDLWIREFCHKHAGPADRVCEDLRFPNELQWLRDNGWALVRCVLPEGLRITRMKLLYGSTAGDDAEGEKALDEFEDWDYLVDTSVPMDDQERVCEHALRALREKMQSNISAAIEEATIRI